MVRRALQAYKGTAPAGEAGSGKGSGFADVMVAFMALRTAPDAGEARAGVYTFDPAMPGFAHTVSVQGRLLEACRPSSDVSDPPA